MHLLEKATGQLLKANIRPIFSEDLLNLSHDQNFTFDWYQETQHELYGIHLLGKPEVLGLISLIDIPNELRIHINLIESSRENRGKRKNLAHIPGCLIAFACRRAFKKGYDGFVSLIPKTKLIHYYRQAYGFIQVGKQLAVFAESSQAIINAYLNHEEV